MRLRRRRLQQRIKTNYTNRTDYKQMKETLIFHSSLFTFHLRSTFTFHFSLAKHIIRL